MYIKTVAIKNVRSIANLTWQIHKEQAAGWHVILGDNGAGKTAFVRSIVLALIGQERAWALRPDWNFWLRAGETKGSVKLNLLSSELYDQVMQIDNQESASSAKSVFDRQHEQMLFNLEDKIYGSAP